MARVIIYEKKKSGNGHRLMEVISVLVPLNKIAVCRSLESLTESLAHPKPNGGRPLSLLLASDREDLLDLLSARDILEDTYVLLILPDEEPGIMALAHQLRPRFISFMGSNFSDIAGVAAKLLA